MKPELRYLREDELASWEELVARSPQGTLFCRSWWLRAACGPDFRILAYFDGGNIVAGIPLYFKRRWPLRVCTMPPLTPSLGPVLEPLEGRRVARLSRENDLLKIIASRVAEQRVFCQSFHYTLQNWLPFRWAGFRQTSRVTYVLEDLSDVEALWGQLRRNIRKEIKKATRQGIRVVPTTPETVFAQVRKTFARQNLRLPFTEEYYLRIAKAAQVNGAGQFFAAIDPEERVHSALLIVWDSKSAYSLAGAADPELRTSGATSLLTWELIKLSAARTQVFDFEGSSIEKIERLFRAFGGTQRFMNRVYKMPPWLEILPFVRNRV